MVGLWVFLRFWQQNGPGARVKLGFPILSGLLSFPRDSGSQPSLVADTVCDHGETKENEKDAGDDHRGQYFLQGKGKQKGTDKAGNTDRTLDYFLLEEIKRTKESSVKVSPDSHQVAKGRPLHGGMRGNRKQRV